MCLSEGGGRSLAAWALQVTQGYTGADLRAILSEAHLLAVHEHIAQLESGEIQVKDASPLVIGAGHLGEAMERSHPSIGPAERARLDRQYALFATDRDTGIMTPERNYNEAPRKRATLA